MSRPAQVRNLLNLPDWKTDAALGYTLGSLVETSTGLTAKLVLSGAPCNAFGRDIEKLTIEVTYESQERSVAEFVMLVRVLTILRLHVKISDDDQKQYTIPESVIALAPPSKGEHRKTADLVFHYEPSPFAFWITRRSDSPGAAPLFDTRSSSLPSAPIPPVISDDNSTALDGFPLVFEDQYLQVSILST